MASSPVTAPSTPGSTSPPPPDSASPPPPPPSMPSSSPPPPSSSIPPPPPSLSTPSPPPPEIEKSPPSPPLEKSPPPPEKSSLTPAPPPDSSSSSPVSSSSPPPPLFSSPPPPLLTSYSPPSQITSSSPPPPLSTSSSPPSRITSSPPPPSTPNTSTPLSPSDSSNVASIPPPPPTQVTSRNVRSPPPPSSSTPTQTKKSSPTTSTQDGLSNLNVPLIVGTIVGVGFFFVILFIGFICFTKKKKPREKVHYYADPSQHQGSDYYNHGSYQSWHSSPNPMNLPPPPGGVGWKPPPPQIMNGDMSSNFSGPRQPLRPPQSPASNMALGFNKSTFSYEELMEATNGFSTENMLGQGGFGYVYKGVLTEGKEVAVKSLKAGSGQGEREFQAEVEIISRVHHRHLVSLVGYCIASGQRMLVYEFVPNRTLDYHLHGKGRPTMDWPTRLKIALGSAKGLAYLHEDCHPRIIHRDIKAANILLDNNFEAMVADFGLAKLSSDTNTHVSTRVMGTFGYLAPEYASSGKLTEKSDVFSFGVMLLELITGRRPVDPTLMEDSLVEWARPIVMRAMEDGNYNELLDPRLGNDYEPTEVARVVACAGASIRHSGRRRPKMSQIVRALEGDLSLDVFKESIEPQKSRSYTTSDYDSSSNSTDMRRFRRVAFGSQEFSSSEYGSESGQSREMN